MAVFKVSVRALTLLTIAAIATFNYVFLSWWILHAEVQKPYGKLEYDYPMFDVMLTVGDSITQFGSRPEGFVTRLSWAYERRMDVLNRGFSGYNTTGIRRIMGGILPVTRRVNPPASRSLLGLHQLLGNPADSVKSQAGWLNNETGLIWPPRDHSMTGASRKLQLCTIFLGTNDAAHKSSDQHVPLEEYADNLRYFVSLLRDPDSPHYSPDTRVLFITPPPVGDRLLAEYTEEPWDRKRFRNERARVYADKAMAVAIELGVPYIDLYSTILELARKEKTRATKAKVPQGPTLKYDGYNKYLYDGLHLSKDGNLVLYRMIMRAIRENWPEIYPKR